MEPSLLDCWTQLLVLCFTPCTKKVPLMGQDSVSQGCSSPLVSTTTLLHHSLCSRVLGLGTSQDPWTEQAGRSCHPHTMPGVPNYSYHCVPWQWLLVPESLSRN